MLPRQCKNVVGVALKITVLHICVHDKNEGRSGSRPPVETKNSYRSRFLQLEIQIVIVPGYPILISTIPHSVVHMRHGD